MQPGTIDLHWVCPDTGGYLFMRLRVSTRGGLRVRLSRMKLLSGKRNAEITGKFGEIFKNRNVNIYVGWNVFLKTNLNNFSTCIWIT